jgi:hypothetical protein
MRGLSVHCHHTLLIEYCHDYDERAEYIKSDKPKNEQNTRLRLFKMLSKAAIKELPKRLTKAEVKYFKIRRKYYKSLAGYAAFDKAKAELDKAGAAWKESARTKWHEKWCGCKEWNGSEIVFKGA